MKVNLAGVMEESLQRTIGESQIQIQLLEKIIMCTGSWFF